MDRKCMGGRATAAALACAALTATSLLMGPTGAAHADQNWNIGSYNIGDAHYGGFLVAGGDTAASIGVPFCARWQEWDVQTMGPRSQYVGNRVLGSYNWGDGTASPFDLLSVQEASTRYVNCTTAAARAHRAAFHDLANPASPQGMSFAVGFATLDAAAGDAITVGGQPAQRTMARSTHILYRNATVSLVASGIGVGQWIIASPLRAGYLGALGTTFANSDQVNKDQVFPWAVLRSAGASGADPVRTLLVSSVHLNIERGYLNSTPMEETVFYNGEIMRGVANDLESFRLGYGGTPFAVIGDLNNYYKTVQRSNGTSAKSPPRLLSDWGMTDARPFKQTITNCASQTNTCKPYGTLNIPAPHHGTVVDYIFTYPRVGGGTTLVGSFQTVSDNGYTSDHKAIGRKIRFS